MIPTAVAKHALRPLKWGAGLLLGVWRPGCSGSGPMT
jgi:hypothetical protein